MKRPAPKLPPFPLQWECDVCQLKGLTVQRHDDGQALACVLCERIFCAQCRRKHFMGGQLCLRRESDRAA